MRKSISVGPCFIFPIYSVCEFLLDLGLNPNEKDDDQDTPLVNAIYNGSQPLGKL